MILVLKNIAIYSQSSNGIGRDNNSIHLPKNLFPYNLNFFYQQVIIPKEVNTEGG